MELRGNRGEWSELYALLKLLADGRCIVETPARIDRMTVFSQFLKFSETTKSTVPHIL